MRLPALVIGLLLAGIFPAAACADPPVPLPDDVWVLPATGYQHAASSFPNATNFEMFDFTIYADLEDVEFDVKVATSTATDTDGELADVVGSYVAAADPRAPEVFTARTTLGSAWLATLGTYYWQAYYTADDGTVYSTKLQRIQIIERPPPDPPSQPEPQPQILQPAAAPATPPATIARRLTRTLARTLIKWAIRSRTHRSAQELTTSCSLPNETSADCAVAWRAARYRYRANAELSSTITGIRVTLAGTRTRRACSRKPCSRAIRWSLTMI